MRIRLQTRTRRKFRSSLQWYVILTVHKGLKSLRKALAWKAQWKTDAQRGDYKRPQKMREKFRGLTSQHKINKMRKEI